MGKRLTPEEREARIKAYEEAKAARQAVRLEKRKARVEAYEKAKAAREKRRDFERRGARAVESSESSRVGQVKRFPTYKGEVNAGDEVGFRWIGMALTGKVLRISKERNYRVREDGETEVPVEEKPGAMIVYYHIKDSDGTFYPIKRNDILAKKINNKWIDSCK